MYGLHDATPSFLTLLFQFTCPAMQENKAISCPFQPHLSYLYCYNKVPHTR